MHMCKYIDPDASSKNNILHVYVNTVRSSDEIADHQICILFYFCLKTHTFIWNYIYQNVKSG